MKIIVTLFIYFPCLGSADRTVKFWDLETFELIGSAGPEVLSYTNFTTYSWVEFKVDISKVNFGLFIFKNFVYLFFRQLEYVLLLSVLTGGPYFVVCMRV